MHRLTGSLLVLAAAGVSLAAPPDLTKLPAASTQKGVTYAKDIRPLPVILCIVRQRTFIRAIAPQVVHQIRPRCVG